MDAMFLVRFVPFAIFLAISAVACVSLRRGDPEPPRALWEAMIANIVIFIMFMIWNPR